VSSRAEPRIGARGAQIRYRVRPARHGNRNLDRSALLTHHEAARARIQADVERPQVLTYGDVPAEYRAALESACMFDETDRGRLEISGADAIPFLHRILASDVRGVPPGGGSRSLLLSSKGKVQFDFDLARDADGAWLSVPPGNARPLATAIDVYLFSEDVKLRDTSAEHAPIAICGPRAEDLVRSVSGAEPPRADHAWTRGSLDRQPVTIVRLPVAGSPGFRLDAGPALAERLWRSLRDAGATPAGVVARDILRVEAGRALFGVDVDDTIYPQEARMEDAFSLDKGCYIGQEVVAKIDTYGGINKRLVALRISHDEPIERGTRLFREEEGTWRDLGVITSWAYSFVLDTGLVLAYVKRRHQHPGTVFRVGESEATGTIVPSPVRAGAVPVTGEFE
jgi:folate-binding protein YgfZ